MRRFPFRAARPILTCLPLLVALAPLTAAPATADWIDPLQRPATVTARAAHAPIHAASLAGDRLVGVGLLGRIVLSDDRGATWRQASTPVSADLVAVSFPTAKTGWAVGHYGTVLSTRDGGESWIRQLDGIAEEKLTVAYYQQAKEAGHPDAAKMLREAGMNYQVKSALPFFDVHFENERQGWIVGSFGRIFRTEDGGNSWTPWMERVDNPQFLHFTTIRAIAGTLYITSERGTVFRLPPGADRFERVATGYHGTFFGLTGRPGLLVAYGLRGNAFQSRDNGVSWQPASTGNTANLTAGLVLENGSILLATQTGQFLTSSGGDHYRPAGPPANQMITGLWAGHAGTVLVTGTRGIAAEPAARFAGKD